MILRTDPASAGDWAVAAVGDAVVALADAVRLDELVARLGGPDGFRLALDALVSAGITSAPDFALLQASGGTVRVVLRGDAEVEAAGERVTGAGVTTWSERVLDGVDRLRLRVPGSVWVLQPGEGAATSAPAPVPVAPANAATPPADPPAAEPVPIPVVAAPPRPIAREDVPPHTTLAPLREDDEPAAEAPVETSADPDEPYAFLFGDTVYRTVGDAVVHARPGDHDGRTVLVDELEAHEQGELPATSVASGPGLVLDMPGGSVEPIDAPLLVGRAPSDPGHDASGGPPRLVTIAADDKDVSRTHARIEVAGGAVVVTDLDSKNGTSVTLPGTAPRKLRAGEPAVVLPGTVVDLGGGVTMTVREDA
jgi:hypothetical protein